MQRQKPSDRGLFRILCLAVAVVMSPLCQGPARAEAAEGEHTRTGKPNIIILFVDDMGYSDVGCFGGEIEDRENIKRAVELGRAAGLDMTYIYGEYGDGWPITRANYEAWAAAAAE